MKNSVSKIIKNSNHKINVSIIEDYQAKIKDAAQSLEEGMMQYYRLKEKIRINRFRYESLFRGKFIKFEKYSMISELYKAILENNKSVNEIDELIAVVERKYKKQIDEIKRKQEEENKKSKEKEDGFSGLKTSTGKNDEEELKKEIKLRAEATSLFRKIYLLLHEDMYASTDDNDVKERYRQKKDEITSILLEAEKIKLQTLLIEGDVEYLKILLQSAKAIEAYIRGEDENLLYCEQVEKLKKRLSEIRRGTTLIKEKINQLQNDKFANMNLFDNREIEACSNKIDLDIAKKYDEIIVNAKNIINAFGKKTAKKIFFWVENVIEENSFE